MLPLLRMVGAQRHCRESVFIDGQFSREEVCALKVYKNRLKHAFTSWHDWGSPGLRALSLPSFLHFHLQYLNMSRASVLAGAHHFVAHDNMFIAANTVSRMVMM